MKTTELTRGLRAAAGRSRHLLGHSTGGGSAAAGSDGATGSPRPRSQAMVAGDGLRFFHRADCPMVTGREWPVAPAAEHTKAGRVPCGMCRP